MQEQEQPTEGSARMSSEGSKESPRARGEAPGLLSVKETAKRLGLKPPTVRKLIARRELASVRPTKRAVRVRPEDVEILIRERYTPRREDAAR